MRIFKRTDKSTVRIDRMEMAGIDFVSVETFLHDGNFMLMGGNTDTCDTIEMWVCTQSNIETENCSPNSTIHSFTFEEGDSADEANSFAEHSYPYLSELISTADIYISEAKKECSMNIEWFSRFVGFLKKIAV